jgi:4-diphosphocytidyl-2C-methyl-D-erythritol kinase
LLYRNDFLPVFRDREKAVYMEIISRLKELGAGFSGLSGAGSTCFGAFAGKEQAAQAAAVLSKSWNWVKLTFPVKS